jgi:hypothetical protein
MTSNSISYFGLEPHSRFGRSKPIRYLQASDRAHYSSRGELSHDQKDAFRCLSDISRNDGAIQLGNR